MPIRQFPVKPPPELAGIEKAAAELGFAMSCDHQTGALLRTLATSKPGGRFLEIGTGLGAASAWLLDGMDADSHLISLENDARLDGIARDALGRDPRATFLSEDAERYLMGAAVSAEQFDLVFADAWPGKYTLLDDALGLVRQSGFYVIDDMVPQDTWPDGHLPNVQALLEDLQKRAQFSVLALPSGSGVLVACRRA
jgi:predicted O-methyltransferase YrrM